MAKLTSYFGSCFAADHISAGEQIAVGGSNLLNGKMDLCVNADFEKFDGFFEKSKNIQDQMKAKADEIQKWLEDSNIPLDAETFIPFYANQFALNTMYPDISKNRGARSALYEAGKVPNLSEVINNGSAECAEIALLTHKNLEHMGVENQYFYGAVLWNVDWEFADQHSFILVPHEKELLFYDPANPTDSSIGTMPSLHRASDAQVQKWQAQGAQKKGFLVLENMISGKKAAYGIDNHTNIDPARDFIPS
jgi:hypothetical protein